MACGMRWIRAVISSNEDFNHRGSGEMNWEQIIAMNAPSIIVMFGLFIVWLRDDMKRLEDKMDARLSDSK